MKRIIPILLTIVVLCCCNGGRERYPSISKWPSEGRFADSITDLVERGFVYGLPPEKMQQLLDTLIQTSQDKGKVDFFRARHFRQKQMNDSSQRIVFRLQNTIDSLRSPYLWMRLKVAETRHQPNVGRQFSTLIDALGYFRHERDTFMIAHTLIDLSNIMIEMQDYSSALQYLDQAQAAYLSMGLLGIYTRTNINKALIYNATGQKQQEDSIYALLLTDPELKDDLMSYEEVLRNYYLSTDDIEYLNQASRLIAASPTMQHTQAIQTIIYLDYWMRHNDYNRADSIAPLAQEASQQVRSIPLRMKFNLLYSQLQERHGHPDRALKYMHLYLEQLDTLTQRRSEEEVMRMQSQQEIQRQRSEQEARAFSERVRWIILSLLLIIIAISVGWILHRRNLKDKIKKAQAELELEKNQRYLAAKLLAVEEKDKIITTMKKTMHDITQQPDNATDAVRQLESMIKFHAMGQEEWKNFATLFEQVNPQFIRNLKERCPNMAENYVKLASYIYSGMSNQQIARLLMIRPESVHQSRWRLRKLLAIPKEVTLEDGLRELAK